MTDESCGLCSGSLILSVAILLAGSAAGATNRLGYVAVRAPSAVTVFETATGGRVATIPLDQFSRYSPSDIATSPTAENLFVAIGGEVVVVDGATNTVRFAVPPPDLYGAERIATNADGSLVVAMDQGYGLVWAIDPTQGKVAAQSPRFTAAYSLPGIAVTPDGAEAIITEADEEDAEGYDHRRLVVLDTTTGAILRERFLDTGVLGEVAISPDGKTVYVGDWSGYTITVVDRATLETVALVPVDEPAPRIGSAYHVRGLAFAPDGTFAVVVLTERLIDQSFATTVVQIRDTTTYAIRQRIRIDAPAGRPAVDPDTGLVYVPVRDALGRVAVIDPRSGEILDRLVLGEEPVAIAFGPGRPPASPAPTPSPTPRRSPLPAQRCAYIAHPNTLAESGALSIVNATKHLLSRFVPIGRPPTDPWSDDGEGAYGAALSADGTSVYVTTTGALLAIDAATGRVRNRIPVGSGAGPVAVRPDGEIAYVGKSGAIGVVDLKTETMTDAFSTHGTPKDIAFTPDGDLAYLTRESDSDSVLVVDARAHAVTATISVWDGSQSGYTSFGNHLAVAPDGRTVYVAVDHSEAFRPSTVALIDRDGQRVRGGWSLPVDGPAGSIAVHPDGTRVYVAIDPRYVCRDDPATGACVSRHNVVAVLDVASGRALATLPMPGRLSELAASPDGSVLYATDTARGVVTAIDLDTYATLATVTLADAPGRVAVGLASAGCPVQDLVGPLPTRTSTPTWQRTPSPTPTGSPAPESTPTTERTPCSEPCVAVELAGASGFPGERVAVEARLRTGGLAVAGIAGRIEWDTGVPIPERRQSSPDCVSRAGAGANTVFSFGPDYFYNGYGPFSCWVGYDCSYVQARIPAHGDTAPLPDGAVLYRCVVAIDPDAAPGRYTLHVDALEASDASGSALPAKGIDGTIDVRMPDAGESANPTSPSTGGCSIEAEGAGSAWKLFTPILALAVLRRALGRRSAPSMSRAHSPANVL